MQAHELTDARRAELQDLLERREQELQGTIEDLREALARPTQAPAGPCSIRWKRAMPA